MKLRMRNRMSDKVLLVPVLLAALVTAGCETAMMAPARQDTTPDPVRETVAVQELRQEVAELRALWARRRGRGPNLPAAPLGSRSKYRTGISPWYESPRHRRAGC